MSRPEAAINIRLTIEQKQTLQIAAQTVGLPLTTWLREIALREAGRADLGLLAGLAIKNR